MAQQETPGPHNNFGNPPTGEMLRDHQIASRTIANHNTPSAIFGASSIELLRAFSRDPSPEHIRQLLADNECLDREGATGSDIGKAAADKGDLAAMMVARYGRVEDDVNTFRPDEVEALKKWFDNGGGQ